jgi:anti-sigma factor RsiW
MTASFDDHLNLDAIVAFADGEMSVVAFQRAGAHVARCLQCSGEVDQQIAARSWLRSAEAPAMPLSLLDSLRSIPVAMPSEPAADGRSGHPAPGRLSGDEHVRSAHRYWRFRFLGAGALVAGLAVGALVIGADQPDREPSSPGGQLVSGVTSPFVVPVKLDRP